MPTTTRSGRAASRDENAPWKHTYETISAPWTSANLRAIEAWSQSCTALVDGAEKIATELTEFAAKTGEANAGAWRAAMRFDGDFRKLVTEPSNLAAAMSRNCCEEASKVALLITDMSRTTWAPFGSLLPSTRMRRDDG